MKCHYIYTDDGEKVLIPGCIATAAKGIEYCTCRNEKVPVFERELYNKTVKAMREEIKELEHENAYLNRIIKKLTRHETHSRRNRKV